MVQEGGEVQNGEMSGESGWDGSAAGVPVDAESVEQASAQLGQVC